jgi:hypothetical protein
MVILIYSTLSYYTLRAKSQSNDPKRVLDPRQNQSKLDKY